MPRRAPDIVLISVDTLRADAIGAYGSGVTPSPTPWIDSLARDGVLFEQAVSAAPETAPAVASLLTGQYQDRHRVLYNRATLAPERTTLAERLREAGYLTAAFVGNRLLDEKHGFTQGFDHVEVVAFDALSDTFSTDARLAARAGLWMKDAPGDRPWFVWVHLMDPHGPYNSASAWWSRDLEFRTPVARAADEPPPSTSNFGLGLIPAYQRFGGLARLGDYVQRYHGEVRFSDAQIGNILGLLSRTRPDVDRVVVLTADHGESLVEHDELLQHGWYVYDPTVHVPLVVAGTAIASSGRRIPNRVCSVDVAPTILELAGLRADAQQDGVPFTSLLSGAGADEGGEERGCFSVGPRANHPFAISEGRYKAIVTPAGAPADPRAPKGAPSDEPERIELYDLEADPGEARDLAAVRPDIADDLASRIAVFRSRWRAEGLRW